MKRSNIFAVAAKNLNQFKRDPRMIALSIIAPIIVTALFGSVFGGELTELKVLVINNDKNFNDKFSNDIVAQMDDVAKINVSESLNADYAKSLVINNISQAAILFPDDFTEKLLLGKGTAIELYVSYNNTNIANYIVSSFQSSFNNIIEKYFGEPMVTISIVPLYQGLPAPLPMLINVSLYNGDLGWADSNDKLSDDVYEILKANDTVILSKENSESKAEREVKDGTVRAIIIFPENFTYNALVKKEISLEVKLDGAEPQACMAILGVVQYSLAKEFEEKFGKAAFNIDDYYYNNPDSHDEAVKSITYFTPAIIGFIIFFFSYLLTTLSFLRERRQGTMERILTSPLKRSELIIGYILSFSILTILQSTVVLLGAIFLFQAQIQFTAIVLLQAYLILYLLLLMALGLGIFLSTLAKTEFQIIQFIPLIIMPFMLLSGVWAPIETLPKWLQPVSKFIPLTYANIAMRDILIRGLNLSDVLVEIGILAGFACLTIFLGILSLKKKLK